MPEPVQRSAIGNLFFRGLDRIIPGQNYQDGRWNASGRQYALAAVPFVAGFLGGPLASQASRFAINKYEQGRTPQQAFNPQVTRMPMSIPNGFNLGIGRPQFQPTQPMPQPVQQQQGLPNLGSSNLFEGGDLGGWASGGARQGGGSMPGIMGGRLAGSSMLDLKRSWSNYASR